MLDGRIPFELQDAEDTPRDCRGIAVQTHRAAPTLHELLDGDAATMWSSSHQALSSEFGATATLCDFSTVALMRLCLSLACAVEVSHHRLGALLLVVRNLLHFAFLHNEGGTRDQQLAWQN